VNSSDITPGKHYAYRPSPRSREPFQRIEAIEKVATSRGKWKVRLLDDPYPGLEEYVRAACIIAADVAHRLLGGAASLRLWRPSSP
jgi:hypothetical protein